MTNWNPDEFTRSIMEEVERVSPKREQEGRTKHERHKANGHDGQASGGSGKHGAGEQQAHSGLGDTIETICAADVQVERVEWLWPDRFALGKIGLIGGMPEEGKSQITTDIAARVSRGDVWPCSQARAPLGNVIILSAEDGVEDTLVPRLMAADADLSRVHIIKSVISKGKKRLLSLQDDVEKLERKIAEIGDVKLVIIDPVSAYLGIKKLDTFRTSDVRAVLAPVAEMAARTRVAVIGVMHLNKNVSQTSAIARFSDSLAFVAAARHAYLAVRDGDTERRLFLRAKNNLAPSGKTGLAYCFVSVAVDGDILTSRIEWESQPVSMTADQALASNAQSREDRTGKAEAMNLLRDLLAGGPLPVKQIEEAAAAIGLSKKNLRDAREELRIITNRGAFGGDCTWELAS